MGSVAIERGNSEEALQTELAPRAEHFANFSSSLPQDSLNRPERFQNRRS